jgi:Alcohol dehydrogenase transcription factor Myb/SANT-like
MPKDLLDTLIERLERESDQNEQAWEEVVQAFERLSAEERRARKEEFRARFMEYLKRQRDLASEMTLAFEALDAPPPKKPS